MPKLTINPAPSKILCALFFVLHLIAGLAVLMASIPLLAKAICFLLIAASLLLVLYKHVYRQGKTDIQACHFSDGQWTLTLNNQENVIAQLQPSSFVTQWLVILSFKTDKYRKKTLLLAPDSLPSDIARQLRLVFF